MTEYRSVTHTIVELMARKKIKAVPRKDEIDRVDLKNVARPDDDRKGDVPTRQGEIQMKVIDEQELGPITSKEAKKPKKLEIQDVGKQPPTQVEINPELDNTPNLFASTEVKGKPIAETEYKHPAIDPKTKKAFDAANKLKSFQKSHDFQGGDDTPDPRARRDAEEIAKFAQSFSGKSLGGFKITGTLSAKDIEQGAKIRARLNKLKESSVPLTAKQAASKRDYERTMEWYRRRREEENYKARMAADKASRFRWKHERQKKVIDENLSEDKYNSVSVQYQTKNGLWVTARKVRDDPSDVMLAMKTVQKAYSSNRIRAIGPRGTVLDFWPIDQASLQQEDKDYVEVRGRKIYGFKGSPGHKQMEKAAQKLSDREKARRRADKIKTREQDSDKYKKPGWVGPGWNEETQLDELSRETLKRARDKAEKTPQKDVRAMKKIWAGIVWPAEARLSGERIMPKKRGGYRKYHFESSESSKEEKEAFEKFMKYPSGKEHERGMHQALQAFRSMYFRRKYKEQNEESLKESVGAVVAVMNADAAARSRRQDDKKPKDDKMVEILPKSPPLKVNYGRGRKVTKEDTITEYENLGIGAMCRQRQRPSDHKPATSWAGYGKPARKKSEQQNRGLPDLEKTYGAFRRQREREPVKESTTRKLKDAKKRITAAWWDNKGDSTKNLKNINKAISKKELDEGKSDGVPYMGQHGASGTYGLPGKVGKAVEKFSTTLKPPAAELVRYEYNKWANAGAIAAKGVATAATSALPAAASTPASIALMAYGDEPKGYREWQKEQQRKTKSEETILRVLDKIVKDK